MTNAENPRFHLDEELIRRKLTEKGVSIKEATRTILFMKQWEEVDVEKALAAREKLKEFYGFGGSDEVKERLVALSALGRGEFEKLQTLEEGVRIRIEGKEGIFIYLGFVEDLSAEKIEDMWKARFEIAGSEEDYGKPIIQSVPLYNDAGSSTDILSKVSVIDEPTKEQPVERPAVEPQKKRRRIRRLQIHPVRSVTS